MLGAVLINLAKTWLTGSLPEAWLFVLGGLFVLSTLAFPRGVVGVARQLTFRRRAAPPLVEEEAK